MRILPVNNYQSKTQNNKQNNVNFSQKPAALKEVVLELRALRELPQIIADGDYTAEHVCKSLLANAPKYDNRADVGLNALFTLQTEHIYGEDVCRLHEDVCGGNIGKMVKVLRAREAGIIGSNPLHNDIERMRKIAQGDTVESAPEINVDEVVAIVDKLSAEGKLDAGAFYYDYSAGRQLIR